MPANDFSASTGPTTGFRSGAARESDQQPQRRTSRPVKRHPWLKWLIWTLVGPIALVILGAVVIPLLSTALVTATIPEGGYENVEATLSAVDEMKSSPAAILIAVGYAFVALGAPVLGFICVIGTIVSAVKNNQAYQLAMRDFDEGRDASWYDEPSSSKRRQT